MKRRHYNKAPLVWIANVLYWKGKCPTLYNTLRRFLSATDEYPVENTHSIIRAQTCDGDSAEMLERKAKAVFQSKASQSNFRSHFTPPKNYIFRHNQLKSLTVEGASILSEILSRIAADELGDVNDDLDELLTGMVNCGGTNHLPLGYQCPDPPKDDLFCDWPGCLTEERSNDWFVVDACWHAFHRACVRGVSYCPICRAHLKEEISRLAEIAKTSIFGNQMQEESKHENDGDDGRENSAPIVVDMPEDEISKKMKEISIKIKSLKPCIPKGEKNTKKCPKLCEAKKPPHYTRCKHTTRGHSGKGKERKCDKCPNKMCSPKGPKIPCSCTWHLKFSIAHTEVNFEDLLVKKVGIVHQVLLPWKYSQCGLLGKGIGVNSCSAISTITCQKVQLGKFLNDGCFDDAEKLARDYTSIMKQGNSLYKVLPRIDGHANMYVEDVIQHADLPLYMPQPWDALHNIKLRYEKVSNALQKQKEATMVLIINPDKAMALCIKNGVISLFDSHFHQNKGAAIAYAMLEFLYEFCVYIETFLATYFNTSITGANFLEICQIEE
eukprot:Seg4082.2 transcript_id=Seg4082.2/GoldUCD/mRNA.D3Y31 product="hypothetical protein" protein_id=Seg4082.2/GoldUCD/D3Y31